MLKYGFSDGFWSLNWLLGRRPKWPTKTSRHAFLDLIRDTNWDSVIVRSRDNTPYEIMRSGSNQPGNGGPARSPRASSLEERIPIPEPGADLPDVDRDHGMWARWRHPIVIRLPRGYMVVLAMCFLGLLLVSYMAGEQRGYKRGRSTSSRDLPPGILQTDGLPLGPIKQPPGTIHTPVSPIDGVDKSIKTKVLPSNPGQVAIHKLTGDVTDPRQPGMWYFVLVHSDEAYASRVVQYLWGEGVEAAAVKGHNTRLFRVVALQGFTSDEKHSKTPPYQQYSRHLRLLGRTWKAKHTGAKAWEDLYPSQYQGANIDALLTRSPTNANTSPKEKQVTP